MKWTLKWKEIVGEKGSNVFMVSPENGRTKANSSSVHITWISICAFQALVRLLPDLPDLGSGFRPCFGQRPSQMSELSGPVSWWISFTKKIVCSLWFVLIQLWGKALFTPLDETLQISLTFEGTSCLDQAGYCLKYSPVVLQPTALDSDMKIWSTMIENASKCRFFLLCSGV